VTHGKSLLEEKGRGGLPATDWMRQSPPFPEAITVVTPPLAAFQAASTCMNGFIRGAHWQCQACPPLSRNKA